MQFPFSIPPHWLRRAAWCVGGVLVVWALAWLTIPALAKRLIEEQGSAALGRTVSVGEVSFRPWSLELTVSDIGVATADGSGKQLTIARVVMDGELESVLRRAPVLDAITVDAAHLRIAHSGDGRYDVDDIVETLNKRASASPSEPLVFALYNLSLNGASVDVVDHSPAGVRRHSVRALHVGLPFLSTLESNRAVKVQPRLAFELNGAQFDTAADGTPFAQTRKGEATLKIAHLDLAPYLAYVPSSLPLRVQSAVLDADLRIGFEQAARPKLGVAGTVKVSGLALADTAGAPVLGVESLQAVLADVRPLDRVVTLASLDLHAPKLTAVRDRAGRINLDLASGPSASNATKIVAISQETTRARGQNGTKNLAAWAFAVERFAVHRGEVVWTDDTVQPSARVTLAQVELQAQAVRWPQGVKPMAVAGSADVTGRGKPARLVFKGQGTPTQATLHASLADAELGLAGAYLAAVLEPGVVGLLDAELDLNWNGEHLQLVVPRLAVRDFALTQAKDKALPATARNADRAAAELPRFKRLDITDAKIDLQAKTGAIGRVAVQAPSAMAHRNTQGQWVAQAWLKSDGTTTDAPWRFSLGELVIADGTFKLDDRSMARPARMELSALQLQMKDLTTDGQRPAALTATARVKSGRTEPGHLAYQGSLALAPLVLQGQLQATDIPLHGLAPYWADQLNMQVLRADTSFKGQLRYAAGGTGAGAGAEVQVLADVALEDFRANSIAGTAAAGSTAEQTTDLGVAEELLSWKSLNLPGLALRMAPGVATVVQVQGATLSDFFARVIVDPTGRVNLQDLVKTKPQPVLPQPQAPAATVATTAPAAPTAVASTESTPMDAIITVGPVSLLNGKVLFSDRFIRPNYSADLTELNGTLSQFSTKAVDGTPALADLNLTGRAEGTAALEISGKINPLAKPLALDIKGRVRDLDLPPLTAYSVKYAGYGINRGKLSVDVTYTVQAGGQLTASNKLVLNQLTFGERVDGAPNSLPIKLAVALLADDNGKIEVNLPIAGSLNDPDFRVGAVVWKVFTNLIGKALTAPFALIAHALQGGEQTEELHAVAFAPGSSELAPAAAQGLDQVAKVLMDRTALTVTVVGTAGLELEREALKRERLKGLMAAEKRRRAVVTGQDTSTTTGPLTDAEYPALLKEVYRRADISKQRNLLGLAKDVPAQEMEALLLQSIRVSEDAMRELALQRGVVVKDYLASRKLPLERLFLGAPTTTVPDTNWKPRAELNVSHR